MKRRNLVCLLSGSLLAITFSAAAQSFSEDWRDIKPATVTLFSRAKYKNEPEAFEKSVVSFKYGVRGDLGRSLTHNNYELQYGNLNLDGDSDWFGVTMVTDDCSRIKDLGAWSWSDVADVPYLPASDAPAKGIRLPSKTETIEQSSLGQVTRAQLGHLYVVHSKDRDSDFYSMFRVEELVPSDHVTISWKKVPSPEKSNSY